MFNYSYKFLFFIILIFSTLISISSNSWLSAWMGLEINLLSIIPLMIDNNNNLMSTEASLKYFLTQALASATLLFSIMIFFMNNNFTVYLFYNYPLMMMMSSLLMKMGAAPFHFWFPLVMDTLSWNNNLILMTWQKIAPFILLSYIMNMNFLFYIIIISTLMGALGGLNQTSLKKILAFSSINHISWMLTNMLYNESIWLIYFLTYSFLSFTLIFLFQTFKIFHINQTFTQFNNNPIIKFCLFLSFLSLGGLPPFLGFMPKWITINMLINDNYFFLLFILLMTTLITLFFYLRISFSAFILNYNKPLWNFKKYYKNFNIYILLLLSFISMNGLLMIPLMFSII